MKQCESLRNAMKKVTLTELSNNIEHLLDEVLETGIPIEINKNGKLLKIVTIEQKDKLKNLTFKPNVIQGNPDDLVNISWDQEVNIDLS
jgi:prevent-host-death family protein